MITVFVLGIRIIMLHPGVEKSESSFTGFERLWQASLEKMIWNVKMSEMCENFNARLGSLMAGFERDVEYWGVFNLKLPQNLFAKFKRYILLLGDIKISVLLWLTSRRDLVSKAIDRPIWTEPKSEKGTETESAPVKARQVWSRHGNANQNKNTKRDKNVFLYFLKQSRVSIWSENITRYYYYYYYYLEIW